MKFIKKNHYITKELKDTGKHFFKVRAIHTGYRLKVMYKSKEGFKMFILSPVILLDEIMKSVEVLESEKISNKKLFGIFKIKHLVKTEEFKEFVFKKYPYLNVKEIEVQI